MSKRAYLSTGFLLLAFGALAMIACGCRKQDQENDQTDKSSYRKQVLWQAPMEKEEIQTWVNGKPTGRWREVPKQQAIYQIAASKVSGRWITVCLTRFGWLFAISQDGRILWKHSIIEKEYRPDEEFKKKEPREKWDPVPRVRIVCLGNTTVILRRRHTALLLKTENGQKIAESPGQYAAVAGDLVVVGEKLLLCWRYSASRIRWLDCEGRMWKPGFARSYFDSFLSTYINLERSFMSRSEPPPRSEHLMTKDTKGFALQGYNDRKMSNLSKLQCIRGGNKFQVLWANYGGTGWGVPLVDALVWMDGPKPGRIKLRRVLYSRGVVDVTLLPDAERLVCLMHDGTVRVWKPRKDEPGKLEIAAEFSATEGEKDKPLALLSSPSGKKLLVIGTTRCSIWRFDGEATLVWEEASGKTEFSCGAWIDDSRFLLSNEAGEIMLYEQ